MLNGRLYDLLGAVRGFEIAGQQQRLLSGVHFVRNGLQSLFPASDQREFHPLSGERKRDRAADPTRRTRYDADFAREIEIHSLA